MGYLINYSAIIFLIGLILEARAKICQIFRSYFGQYNNIKIPFEIK